jgi:hypothetical protein
MKRIIINEDMLADNKVKSIALMQELPKDIMKALARNLTSLGDHPSFPPEEEYKFDSKITLERFQQVKDDVLSIEDLADYSVQGLSKAVNQMMLECQEIENANKEALEKLCFNIVVDLFAIPEDIINFSCTLTDSISPKSIRANVKPVSTDMTFIDINHMNTLSDEVYKRRLIDALITGAAMNYSKIKKEYIGDLYEMNPKLPKLYRDIIKIMNYLMFVKNDIGISDEDKKQIGVVNVLIGNRTRRTEINAEGVIFPVLLMESIKGMMEAFAAHGLPKNKKEASYVMSKADFLAAEPWDMRMGPILWDCFEEAMQEKDTKMVPNIFVEIVSLPIDEFNNLMKEIFAKTKKSKKVFELVKQEIEERIEYSDFQDRMQTKSMESNVINDEFLR